MSPDSPSRGARISEATAEASFPCYQETLQWLLSHISASLSSYMGPFHLLYSNAIYPEPVFPVEDVDWNMLNNSNHPNCSDLLYLKHGFTCFINFSACNYTIYMNRVSEREHIYYVRKQHYRSCIIQCSRKLVNHTAHWFKDGSKV